MWLCCEFMFLVFCFVCFTFFCIFFCISLPRFCDIVCVCVCVCVCVLCVRALCDKLVYLFFLLLFFYFCFLFYFSWFAFLARSSHAPPALAIIPQDMTGVFVDKSFFNDGIEGCVCMCVHS